MYFFFHFQVLQNPPILDRIETTLDGILIANTMITTLKPCTTISPFFIFSPPSSVKIFVNFHEKILFFPF